MADGQPVQLRLLSQRQAQRCEDACEPVCKCRCGGALHGAKRGAGLTFLNALPESDPHFVPSAEWRKAKKRAERDALAKRRLAIISSVRSNYDY